MAVHLEADHMLVAFHQSVEPATEIAEEVLRLDVRNKIRKPACCFNTCKFLFKPLNLIAWIIAIFHQVPIEVIGDL